MALIFSFLPFLRTDDPLMVSNSDRQYPESSETASKMLRNSLENLEKQRARKSAWQFAKSQTFPQRKSDSRPSALMCCSEPGNRCPPYGSKSVVGRRAKMEDSCTAIPNLVEIPVCWDPEEILPPRIAPQLRSARSSDRGESIAETNAVESSNRVDASHGKRSETNCSDDRVHVSLNRHSSVRLPTIEFPKAIMEVSSVETLHFFGVFDGHGGADAATHCAKTLHEHVRNVLSSSAKSPASANGESFIHEDQKSQDEKIPGGVDSVNMVDGFAPSIEATDGFICETLSQDTQSNGSSGEAAIALESGTNSLCEGKAPCSDADVDDQNKSIDGASSTNVDESCPLTAENMEAALTKAFHMADEAFGSLGGYESLALVGTTAVVALVGGRTITVANCGDSRAVLCRNGIALPLTDDHKAGREDETARVEAAGGQILFWNGVRVMGLLAVSRAIGDHSLRPYVIPEPEVTVLRRHPSDEMLIIATDGLWDVMNNQEACTLAKKCLVRARQRGSSRENAARVAATVLTRAAVDRGSRDNVTVVIVDLTDCQDSESGLDAAVRASLLHQSDSLPINMNICETATSAARNVPLRAAAVALGNEDQTSDNQPTENSISVDSGEENPASELSSISHSKMPVPPLSPFEVPISKDTDEESSQTHISNDRRKSKEENSMDGIVQVPNMISPFS